MLALVQYFFRIFIEICYVNNNTKKELNQYPAILTSVLVNDTYLFWSCIQKGDCT